MENILSSDDLHIIQTFCKTHSIKEYIINQDGSVDVEGDVNISHKGISELPFKFNIVYGNFTCNNNDLKTLKNMPHTIYGDLEASSNSLTTLEGCPEVIDDYLYINDNYELGTLYVGEYDVNVSGVVFDDCDFPMELIKAVMEIIDYEEDVFEDDYQEVDYDSEKMALIFKHQRLFEIWNKDLSLNEENFNELIEEIKDGLQ